MTFDSIDKAAARHAGEAGLSEPAITGASPIGDVEDIEDTDEDADDELSDDESSDDETAVMAAESDTETGYFGFFGLPRELRDMIYKQDCLWEHELLQMDEYFDPVTKVVRLRTSLLLVNHQMHDEYKEQCEDQQVLRMRDHCDFDQYIAEPYLKRQVCLWELDMGAIDTNLSEVIRELDILFLPVPVGPEYGPATIHSHQALCQESLEGASQL